MNVTTYTGDNAVLRFEHELRAKLNQFRNHIEASTGASYITISFVCGSDGGKWQVNSWGGSTADITTKGAVLETVIAEHIRRVGTENALATLPAMLEAPRAAPHDPDATMHTHDSGVD